MYRLLLLGIILSGGSLWSQAATESVKTSEHKSLQQVFAVPVFAAYQENSDLKIQELFFYLQQLSQTSLEASLRNEMEIACLALFVNDSTLVVDVTSTTPTLIPIKTLFQKLAQTAPLQLTVSERVNYNSVTYQSWKNGYTVRCIQNEATRDYTVAQTVFFQLQPQQFGSHEQQTYQYRLGNMELR
ncbi:hypothetical protein [Flavobacterium sp. N1719]|uniref:hypothetical protein n=1 Tax=Flavobacterium sp. N1719 TaxID=2885633 RepID=UPI0022212BC8|nr:hypothetical protein [Flavobacterium sp. N1719]